jgi:hypothetical protein
MTQPLNYTTKAITDLGRLVAGNPALGPQDREGVLFLQRKLRQAEVFVLPDSGELLDRSKPRPQVPGAMFHPPFPVVALEYRSAIRNSSDPVFQVATASKRIALAWEWDGVMPGGDTSRQGPKPGEGVCIASISFMDEIGSWFPMIGAIMVPFDCKYASQDFPLTEAQKAFIASGRITEKQAHAEKIEVRAVLPILPGPFARCAEQFGMSHAMDVLQADLMDEVNAYLDLCLALGCNNVGRELHAQPARLNKARIKSGKPPLKDFHVLTLAGDHGQGGAFAGVNGSGVRSHLRRGHIRRLGPDRVTWVNSCMVRGSRPGFASKHYAAKPVGQPAL